MIKSSNRSKETFSPQTQRQIENVLSRAGSFKTEVEHILEPYNAPVLLGTSIYERVENLFLKFHSVAVQLQRRQRKEKMPFLI